MINKLMLRLYTTPQNVLEVLVTKRVRPPSWPFLDVLRARLVSYISLTQTTLSPRIIRTISYFSYIIKSHILKAVLLFVVFKICACEIINFFVNLCLATFSLSIRRGVHIFGSLGGVTNYISWRLILNI